MPEQIEVGYFDPSEGLEQTQRKLPHWFQPNVATFSTFRTADSLPAEVVRRWEDEQRTWLRDRGIVVADHQPIPDRISLAAADQFEFRKHKIRRWNCHLDSCHGTCALRNRDLAEIVIQSLRHFDGQRYDLDCAIVMPNHVHLLVQFREGTTCRAQCQSWLRYTARQINQRIGRNGAFWQGEPFDHLVRSAEQFEYLRRYIAENGRRANLPDTDYLFWKREMI